MNETVIKPIRTFVLEFKGVDEWSRPVFKVEGQEIYFGSTEILFPDKRIAPLNTAQEIVDYFRKYPETICYFGVTFDGDPNGGRADNWRYQFKNIKL